MIVENSRNIVTIFEATGLIDHRDVPRTFDHLSDRRAGADSVPWIKRIIEMRDFSQAMRYRIIATGVEGSSVKTQVREPDYTIASAAGVFQHPFIGLYLESLLRDSLLPHSPRLSGNIDKLSLIHI